MTDGRTTTVNGRMTGICPACGKGPMYELLPSPDFPQHAGVCAWCKDTANGLYNAVRVFDDDNQTLFDEIHKLVPESHFDNTGGGCMVTYATTPQGLFTLACTDEGGISVYLNSDEECAPEDEVDCWSRDDRWGFLTVLDVHDQARAFLRLFRYYSMVEDRGVPCAGCGQIIDPKQYSPGTYPVIHYVQPANGSIYGGEYVRSLYCHDCVVKLH
jgi:hypothetical protein